MGIRQLEYFFEPRSIVVVGASEKATSLGGVVLRNLQAGGFGGSLMAVNRHRYAQVYGVPCRGSVDDLPEAPDLAVVCTPPETVLPVVRALGRRGVKSTLVLMGGLSRARSQEGGLLEVMWDLAGSLFDGVRRGPQPLRDLLRREAYAHGMRILGPNSIGVLVPRARLNASYAHLGVSPGAVAFVGQSGITGCALIDWAAGRGIGFSHFLTLGDSVDVDIADVIDYLAEQRSARQLVLHVEHTEAPGRFISAVRAASRRKVVMAIKTGRFAGSREQDLPPTPGLVDEDAVWDAVLARAGALRAARTDDLLGVLTTVSRMRRQHGDRLAIMCNGVGPNVLAADALLEWGGRMATLDPSTLERLDALLPPYWTRKCPVDLSADASPGRYAGALTAVAADPGVDAVLVIYAPTLAAAPMDTAKAVIEAAGSLQLNVLTCWMGEVSVKEAREALDAAGLMTYENPESAVRAFTYMVNHASNQEMLRETPRTVGRLPDGARVWAVAGAARDAGRDYLTPREVRRVLRACRIPSAPTRFASTVRGAVDAARRLTGAVALKAVHPAQCHPYEYGPETEGGWRGVATGLDTPARIRRAAERLQSWVGENFPDSQVQGYLVQEMRRGMNSLQLAVGVTRDPVFGPVLVFGRGGRAADVLRDRRVALPPLNLTLARHLVRSSPVSELIGEYTEDADAAVDALCEVLVRLGQLVAEVPVVRGLEINPLLLNREGLLALDAAMDLGPPVPMAIHPYPDALREVVMLPSGREVELRPIRGEDEPAHLDFARRLSPESVRLRFFHSKSSITHEELVELTQIDYAREMAFIASAVTEDGTAETLGVVRAVTDPDNVCAEFAVIVRDDQRGQGLAPMLLEKMIAYVRQRGTLRLMGTVLSENKGMLRLASRQGFERRHDPEEGVEFIWLDLNEPVQGWQRERLSG